MVDPLSYVVELLHGYLLNVAMPHGGYAWVVLLVATVAVQVIAAYLYPSIHSLFLA